MRIWKALLRLVFVWAAYHLVRDILQDIFGVHNRFTEFLHYEAQQELLPQWLKIIHLDNNLGRWLTIPIAVFYLLAVPISWRIKKFGILEVIMIAVGVYVGVVWLTNVVYDSRTMIGRQQLPYENTFAEVDYKKEIERDLPLSLKKVENRMVFIYGEYDKFRGTTGSLIGNYITVPGGTHNTFRTNPQGTLEAVKNSLD